MRIFVLSILFTALPLFLGAQDQQAVAAPAQKKFSSAQLEQLVAPIALYPDSLVAQVLASSTYPVDIVEAARWVKHNPDLSQDDFKNEVQSKNWDPSVKGLVFFPQLLAKLNDNLDWTTDLGNAFLSQQADVMDTIQAMRAKAQTVGTLKSDSNQTVNSTQDGDIQIQSANPDTVYVQDYVPSTAYGSSWTSDNSNGYYPEVIAAPAWPWGCYGGAWALGYNCGWRNGWIGYNNNYYNNHFINPNKYGPNNLYDPRNPGDLSNRQWRHDSANTRPLTQNTQQIARQLETENRVPQNFRGVDNAASNELRQALNESPRDGEAARSLQNAERAGGGFNNNFQQENSDHAFSGSRDAGLDQAYSNRGYESRSISCGGEYHSGGYRGGGHGGGRR